METTNDKTEKKIDAVKVMREIRDKISLEVSENNYSKLIQFN